MQAISQCTQFSTVKDKSPYTSSSLLPEAKVQSSPPHPPQPELQSPPVEEQHLETDPLPQATAQQQSPSEPTKEQQSSPPTPPNPELQSPSVEKQHLETPATPQQQSPSEPAQELQRSPPAPPNPEVQSPSVDNT